MLAQWLLDEEKFSFFSHQWINNVQLRLVGPLFTYSSSCTNETLLNDRYIAAFFIDHFSNSVTATKKTKHWRWTNSAASTEFQQRYTPYIQIGIKSWFCSNFKILYLARSFGIVERGSVDPLLILLKMFPCLCGRGKWLVLYLNKRLCL